MSAAHLTIDLGAIAANWRALDAMSGAGTETGAVVKADAYGLGADRVAAVLRDAGARTFFVAIAEEGLAIRRVVGDEAEIFVFAGHMEGTTEALRGARLIPLLNSPPQIARHFDAAPDVHFGVQLDSGMNRLGLEPSDWRALRDELMANGPRMVMSHLACADDPQHDMNARQLRSFDEMTRGVARRSLSATGGCLLGPEYHFEVTRPGIGLYGGLPFEDATPVVHLEAPVIQTRTVQPFETVGYGNTWTAKVETNVATISAGYADGLHRALGGAFRVYAGDTPCEVIGRVSMDLLTVDISHLDETPETLTILSGLQGIDDLANGAGTIGYEILTSLGARYRRSYTGGA